MLNKLTRGLSTECTHSCVEFTVALKEPRDLRVSAVFLECDAVSGWVVPSFWRERSIFLFRVKHPSLGLFNPGRVRHKMSGTSCTLTQHHIPQDSTLHKLSSPSLQNVSYIDKISKLILHFPILWTTTSQNSSNSKQNIWWQWHDKNILSFKRHFT